MTDIDPKDFQKTLARGLNVIKSFDPDEPTMTLATVAKRTGMTRAAARRFLLTLKHLGYVIQIDAKFQLTAKILEIGYPYLASLDFVDTMTPFMKEVTQKVGKSCSTAVLDLPDVVYVARVPVQNVISLNLQIGSRLPAYVTSMGRMLLSSLPEDELDRYLAGAELQAYTKHTETNPARLKKTVRQARVDGYSMVNQEYESSLRSIAVPIHNRKSEVVCAMNIGFAAHSDSTEEIFADYLPVLLEAARRIEQVLGYRS